MEQEDIQRIIDEAEEGQEVSPEETGLDKLMDVLLNKADRKSFHDVSEHSSGVYAIFDGDELIYVGKTRGRLGERLATHVRHKVHPGTLKARLVEELGSEEEAQRFLEEDCTYNTMTIREEAEIIKLEEHIIRRKKPPYNVAGK